MYKVKGVLKGVEEIDLLLLKTNPEKFWKDVTVIGADAFKGLSLSEIIVPEQIEIIENNAFFLCQGLKKVKLTNVKYIDEYAFGRCNNLIEFDFSNNIEQIEDSAFVSCINLNTVKIKSDKLQLLYNNCFDDCVDLKNVELTFYENSRMYYHTMLSCKNLNYVILENVLKFGRKKLVYEIGFFDYIIKSGDSVIFAKELEFNEDKAYLKKGNGEKYEYNKDDVIDMNSLKNYIYYSNNIQGFNDMIIKMSPENLKKLKNEILPFLKEHRLRLRYDHIQHLFGFEKEMNEYIISNNLSSEILNNLGDGKYFTKIMAMYSQLYMYGAKEYYSLFKLCYTIGVFDKDVNVRQKAGEFVKLMIEKSYLNDTNIEEFCRTNNYKRNPNFAEFLMRGDNFKQISEFCNFGGDDDNKDFLCFIYNNFDTVANAWRSDKGEQKIKKDLPVSKFISLYINKRINNITNFDTIRRYYKEELIKKNPNLSKEKLEEIVEKKILNFQVLISLYYNSPDAINNAVAIYNEFIKNKTKTRILNTHLTETIIEEARKDILNDSYSIVKNIAGPINNHFTYDFLEKDNPDNLILGKYCSCCAHLKGAGYCIMKKSILDENFQNLVVRNSQGKIVAKATIFVNRKQGYAIYNTFSVSNEVPKKQYEEVYNVIKRATKDFVTRYNKENPKPIKIVSVGMRSNKIFIQEDIKGDILLIPPELEAKILEGESKEEQNKNHYYGDWKIGQVMIYNESENTL